jgi:hypothetical protein
LARADITDARFTKLPDEGQLPLFFGRRSHYWGMTLGLSNDSPKMRAGAFAKAERPRHPYSTLYPNYLLREFPFPRPRKEQEAAIAVAAKELDTLRNNWLNPPEWVREEMVEFPGQRAEKTHALYNAAGDSLDGTPQA